jgi:hypothetical protein
MLLCPDSGGDPDTDGNCTAADATVAGDSIGTDYAAVKYNFTSGYSVTNGATHWIKIKASAVAAQYWVIEYYNTGSTAVQYSPDDSSWTAYDSSGQLKFTAKDCVE